VRGAHDWIVKEQRGRLDFAGILCDIEKEMLLLL
jgi:hypothetical protein